MLTPRLDELLELRHLANKLGLVSSQRPHTQLSGLYASVFRGQGMDFDEVREYQPGDEVRHIDWRVTARMRKPYLKIYREERERHVVLCLDIGKHMQFGTRGTFKSIQAAKVAALLGWSAQAHGDRVSGLLFGQERLQFFRPQRDKRSFVRLLYHLTLPPQESKPNTLEEALIKLNGSTHRGALVFIITDFNQVPIEILRRSLSQLHQRYEVVLISIEDPADYNLPAVGPVGFIALNGETVIVNTDNSQGRLAYRQAWEEHRHRLEKIVRTLYIDLLSISTHKDVYQSVLEGLQQRAKKQRSHQ